MQFKLLVECAVGYVGMCSQLCWCVACKITVIAPVPVQGHGKLLNVFCYHQIDISSEKSYGWYCAVGYVGGYCGHGRSWKVMKGHGRSRKVIECHVRSFPIIRLTF